MTFRSWLIVIESHYHNANTYHNSTHAADVMQVSEFHKMLNFTHNNELIHIYMYTGDSVLLAAISES